MRRHRVGWKLGKAAACRLRSHLVKVKHEASVTGWLLCGHHEVTQEHFKVLWEPGLGKAAKANDKSS